MRTIIIMTLTLSVLFCFSLDAKANDPTFLTKERVEELLKNFLTCVPKDASFDDYTFYNPKSACNIAVIEALHYLFNNSELKKNSENIYRTANQISSYLEEEVKKPNPEWKFVGSANDQYSLYKAQCLANKGNQVIAVSEGSPYGHVALILPGKLTKSYTLRKKYPNMFSFFLGKFHKTRIGWGLNYGWNRCNIHKVKIYSRDSIYSFFSSLGVDQKNCDTMPSDVTTPFVTDPINIVITQKGKTTSGYISKKSNISIDRIEASHTNYGIIIADSIICDNSGDNKCNDSNDPIMVCWSAPIFTFKPFNNLLTFTVYAHDEYDNNKRYRKKAYTKLNYPELYFDYIDTGSERRIASSQDNLSSHKPSPIYFDEINKDGSFENIKISGRLRNYSNQYNHSTLMWESNNDDSGTINIPEYNRVVAQLVTP